MGQGPSASSPERPRTTKSTPDLSDDSDGAVRLARAEEGRGVRSHGIAAASHALLGTPVLTLDLGYLSVEPRIILMGLPWERRTVIEARKNNVRELGWSRADEPGSVIARA